MLCILNNILCEVQKCNNFLRPLSRLFSDKKKSDSKPKSKSDDKKPEKKPPDQRVVKVYRYYGDKCTPGMQSFELDVSGLSMVLDIMIRIKEMDPSFTFRRSCREGICGSCAINCNGHNYLSCITTIPPGKTVTIRPLPHMYVLRDLVVDLTHFYNAYISIHPYLITKTKLNRGEVQLAQSIADNNKLVGLYECVLCACCSTSCPSYWWNGRRFLGPAALLHAYRWVIDSRDEATYARLRELSDDFKAFRCHTIMNCELACPKGLSPAIAIIKLKRLIAGLETKPLPQMDPYKFSKDACKCP